MVFIVVALQCEALPFIKKYNLKQVSKNIPFRVYENASYKLVISGTGGTAAICATVSLLTLFNATKDDIVVNCGICAYYGDHSKFLKDMHICSFLRNISNKRDFYPDMLWETPFSEGSLFTVNEPFLSENGKEKNVELLRAIEQTRIAPALIDMEGAFVFEGANLFVYAHNIFILKKVSDRGDAILPKKSIITKMLEEHILEIDALINVVMECSPKSSTLFNKKANELDGIIADNLNLSYYQKNELKKLLRNYTLRGHNPNESLRKNLKTKTKIKREGKIEYEKIKKKLLEP